MSNTSEPITRLDHYRLLGRSGLRVSPLCLGTMTFGTDWGWGADKETSRQIFDTYVEHGGNFIDTADFYTNGTSEKLVGKFIHDRRDAFVLATKYTLKKRQGDPNAAGNHRKSMMTAIEASLKRLDTDYIDLYWLHIWDGTTPVDELMRAFDDLVRQGKVLYIAISDTPAWKIAQLNTYAEAHALTRFISTQVEYSLVQRDAERDILPMCRELGIGLLPWSPLGSGVLTGKYSDDDLKAERDAIAKGDANPLDSSNRIVGLTEQKLRVAEAVKDIAGQVGCSPAQVALNWLLTRNGVTSLIIGARTLEQLEDNLGCLDFTLDKEQLDQLDEVSAIELGFPHDFMASPFIQDLYTAGATIERNA
jgi:aryl-alcohol dehydrogenase-like predicted oxidoreductase